MNWKRCSELESTSLASTQRQVFKNITLENLFNEIEQIIINDENNISKDPDLENENENGNGRGRRAWNRSETWWSI